MSRIQVADLISEIQTELSQVSGVVTSTYGTPRVLQLVQDAYQFLIDEMDIRELNKYHTCTLDGTTGVINADLTTSLDNHDINDFACIKAVWIDGNNRPLPVLPPMSNPNNLSGSTPRYIEFNDTANRPFMVYPIDAEGDIVVLTQARPTLPLTEDSYIYADRLLITYYAAYLYSEDDSTAPGQINKFLSKYQSRYKQLMSMNNNQPVLLDPRFGATNDAWTERQ